MAKDVKITISIVNFAEIVDRYCLWAESSCGESHQEMITARKLLAELYLTVINLPDLDYEKSFDDVNEKILQHKSIVREHFQKMPIDFYWDVFDPFKHDNPEPLVNSLVDDLSDIYRDLKRGCLLYKHGYIFEAAWEWKFQFYIHWGSHLVFCQLINDR